MDACICLKAHAASRGLRAVSYRHAYECDRYWKKPSLQREVILNSLITGDERARLLANGQARAAAPDYDPWPVVKLFTADAHAIWLLAALDPADSDTAWGLCDVGIGMPELGTVRLSDLASIVGPLNRPVMRDRYFKAARSLAEYARLARLDGSILN